MRVVGSIVMMTALLGFAQPAAADSLDDVRAGNDAYNAGSIEQAADAFTRAIVAGDLEPAALAIAFNNRGVAYADLGDVDGAVADYQRALGLLPGDARTLTNLRIGYLRRAASEIEAGRNDTALADYNRAIEAEPEHPTAWLRRGQLRAATGDLDAAAADLDKARALDPDDASVIAAISRLDRQRGRAAPGAGPNEAPPALAAAEPAPAAQPEPSPGPPAVAAVALPAAAAPGPATEPTVGRRVRAIQSVSSRSGPGNNYPRIGALQEGTEVEVRGERLGWLEVELPGGGRGFIYSKWLRPVDE